MGPLATCSIEGCDKGGRIRRGWCTTHYTRWLKHGDPCVTTPPAASRRTSYGQWRATGQSIDDAALLVGVCRRTADRYEQRMRQERGVIVLRRPGRWMDPLIVAHLRAHPGLRLSVYELSRVVGAPRRSSPERAVRRLVAAGQILMAMEPKDDFDRDLVRRFYVPAQSAQHASELREAA